MNVQFIAHRGESGDAPENTLPAFRLAMIRDVDGVECDVYFTRDRQVVCSHDKTTLRASGTEYNIMETNFSELQKLNVGMGNSSYENVRIPTLYETLKTLKKGKNIYIEIKDCSDGILEAIKGEIEKAGTATDDVTIICFNEDILKKSKSIMPNIKTLWLAWLERKDGNVTLSAKDIVQTLKNNNADGVDIYANRECIDAEYVAEIKKNGYLFAVWTVDDVPSTEYFIGIGVDSVTSNCAAKIRDIIKSKQ